MNRSGLIKLCDKPELAVRSSQSHLATIPCTVSLSPEHAALRILIYPKNHVETIVSKNVAISTETLHLMVNEIKVIIYLLAGCMCPCT